MVGVTWEVAHLRFDESHDLAALIRLGTEWQRQHGKPGPPSSETTVELNLRALLRVTARSRNDWAVRCIERLTELGLISYSAVEDGHGVVVRLEPDGIDLLVWAPDPIELAPDA